MRNTMLTILVMAFFIVSCSTSSISGEAKMTKDFTVYFDDVLTSQGFTLQEKAMMTKFIKDSFSSCVEQSGMTVTQFYDSKVYAEVDIGADPVIGSVTDCMNDALKGLESESSLMTYKQAEFPSMDTIKINNFARALCSKGTCLSGLPTVKERLPKNVVGQGVHVGGWDISGDVDFGDRTILVTATTDASRWW